MVSGPFSTLVRKGFKRLRGKRGRANNIRIFMVLFLGNLLLRHRRLQCLHITVPAFSPTWPTRVWAFSHVDLTVQALSMYTKPRYWISIDKLREDWPTHIHHRDD